MACNSIKGCLIVTLFFLSGCTLFSTTFQTPSGKHITALWRTQTLISSKPLSPVLTHDLIITADHEGHVNAIQRNNGKPRWKIMLHSPLSSELTLSKKYIFVGTEKGILFAILQRNGKIVWRQKASSEILATPVVNGNILIVKSIDDHVFAFSAEKGHLLWEYQAEQMPDIILRKNNFSSAPCILDNNVFIGFSNGDLISFQLQTGKIRWEKNMNNSLLEEEEETVMDADITLMAAPGVLYAADHTGQLAAFEPITGKMLWTAHTATLTHLLVGKKYVYASDTDNTLWAFDKSTGIVIWRQPIFNTQEITAPILTEHALIVGNKIGFLMWIHRDTGALLGKFFTGKVGLTAASIIKEKEMILYFNDGLLTTYRIS